MRKLLILLPLMLLSCAQESDDQMERERVQGIHNGAKDIINQSVVECADGNQIRMFVRPYGNDAIVAVWPILDENGKPKRCVRKAVPTPQQFEEVPQ